MVRKYGALLASLGLPGLVLGCYSTGDQHIYSYCKAVERGYVDPIGQVQPCPNDGGAGGNDGNCIGECLPDRPNGWDDPELLWIGSTDETPPDCPTDQAPTIGYEGFADLVTPGECPTCSCLPPTGSCKVPDSITARAAICGTPGAWTMSFDGPSGWDGACTNANAIPQGVNCGGSPCVQSLSIAPLQVVEDSCYALSGPPPVPLGPAYWKTKARACKRVLDRSVGCGDFEHVCAPKPGPPPPEFRQCIFHEGEQDCPSFSEYQDRFVFYRQYQGEANCTPCVCGAPQGSLCSGKFAAFADNACSTSSVIEAMISSVMSVCVDFAWPGQALQSKSITGITYQPGACQASGGEVTTVPTPAKAATFCCLPKP